jgi:hypothetical protein
VVVADSPGECDAADVIPVEGEGGSAVKVNNAAPLFDMAPNDDAGDGGRCANKDGDVPPLTVAPPPAAHALPGAPALLWKEPL